MVKVSVLVPIYNVEKYLRQCLDSLVHQTLQDIEIICINDGSTDSSLEIVKEFAAKDSRIRVIDKENSGYGASMNMGLSMAAGEYIGIVESDDFASLEMFEGLYHIAQKYDVDVVKSNFNEFRENKERLCENLRGCDYLKVFEPNNFFAIWHCMPSIWSAIYRRSFLEKNSIRFLESPGASYQDTSFNLKVLFCSEKMILLKDAFYHYRIDNSNSSVKSDKKIFCVCDEYAEFWRFIENRTDGLTDILYLIPALQFGTYQWNYDRLADRYKKAFFREAQKEFLELEKNGFLKRQYWTDDEWLELQKFLHPDALYKSMIHFQEVEMLREGLLRSIAAVSGVSIYGAGKVAKSVYKDLKALGVSVSEFLVASNENNPSDIDGISVAAISEDLSDRERKLVLLAVTEKAQLEILSSLVKAGYRNIIAMDNKLRHAISRHEVFSWSTVEEGEK